MVEFCQDQSQSQHDGRVILAGRVRPFCRIGSVAGPKSCNSTG
jgi:hypothetical protein